MTRRSRTVKVLALSFAFAGWGWTACLFAAEESLAGNTNRPNVLFLVVDDLRPGEVVRLRLPLLGMAEVPARLEAVSPQVRPATEAVDDPTSGLPPLVVVATIALDDAFCADHDLPPGTQAWLELSP